MDYMYIIKNLLYIFIVFIFSISTLLVINSLYNLTLISVDYDNNISESEYNKYKSIRDLLGYKILMNSYKSGYTSTSEYYNDTYLTLNINSFLLRLTLYITLTSIVIFVLITYLSYHLENSTIKYDLNRIMNENTSLIIACASLLFLLISFNIANKASIKNYNYDRLDAKGTAENNFIKHFLIHYIERKDPLKVDKHIKISHIRDAIKNNDKNTIFETILNKLKYLNKYNIEENLRNTYIKTATATATATATLTDIQTTVNAKKMYIINTSINKSNIDEEILKYCYYLTLINKNTNIDPVKLIYEFIKKIKQIVLEKGIDKYSDDFLDIHMNLMGLGEEFTFLYKKITPSFSSSSYNSNDDNKKILDDKYENLFIESLYTCDFMNKKNFESVSENTPFIVDNMDDIKANMKNAKKEKIDTLITIVVFFLISLLAIFIYLNKSYISFYYYWIYLDNTRKDTGAYYSSYYSFSNYILNLPKAYNILKKKGDK